MDSLNCPHCGGPVLNDRRLAGQVVACPGCHQAFRMPAAEPPAGAPAGPPPQPPAAAPPPPPAGTPAWLNPGARAEAAPAGADPAGPLVAVDRKGEAARPRTAGAAGEPWYFRIPEGWARGFLWLVVGLGAAGFVAAAVGSFYLAFTVADHWAYAFGLVVLLLTFAVALTAAWVLAAVYFVAAVLLLADAARSLREARKGAGRKPPANPDPRNP